jgi:hypothetical protein
MARKPIRRSEEEQRAYDERTKEIWEYIEKLRRRIEERKAREAETHQS